MPDDRQTSKPLKFVTIGGDCFELGTKGQMEPPNRDGIVYRFHVTDMAKNRGKRRVSVFSYGSNTELPNYEARIDVVCLNRIRRAFDTGTLSFDAPDGEEKYKELPLDASGFEPQTPATEDQVRHFIKNQAYWLGYRYSANLARHFISFDLLQDLEYLGVGAEDVRRNAWRLQQEGLLEKGDVLGLGRPTLQLIREFEATRVPRAQTEESMVQGMGNKSRDIFLVHGHDEAMKVSVARFLEKLKLNSIILSEKASKGRTIIEKFEAHAVVEFAVVLLSPDDFGGAKGKRAKPRARQNVILELGYFLGKLGRDKVCALYAGGVELPSDLHGLVWVSYEGNWKLALAREIKEAGIDVDLNLA